MTDTASPPTHAARANIFQTKARWRLGADALVREGGEPAAAPWWAHALRLFLRVIWPWSGVKIEPGGAARFPHAGITELRLSFDPTRFDTHRYRCDVRIAGGAGTLWSTHFAGVGEFEDRAATYTPFVRAVIARVAAANPNCTFRAGTRPLAYWAGQLFLLAMTLVAIWVIAMVGGSALSEVTWTKLFVVIGLIPLALAYARKNRPRRFLPSAIPDDVLPSGNTD
jgi:hypothetical protein